LGAFLGYDIDELGGADVEAFLSGLVQRSNVSPSTQNLPLSALASFFREVLPRPLEGLEFARLTRPRQLLDGAEST